MAVKCGQEDHCCWLNGEICQYLVEIPEGEFRYRCGLHLKYGSWEDAYASPEYQRDVAPKMAEIGYGDIGCGDWPRKGQKCNTCGMIG